MPELTVALVATDPARRLELARAFDDAPPSWRVTLHDSVPAGVDVVVVGEGTCNGDEIAFDPVRPGAALEAVRSRVPAPLAEVVAVTSASGGVGVTTLCLHLAAAFAKRAPTCLVDLDFNGGLAARLALPDDHLTWAGIGPHDSGPPPTLPVRGARVLPASPSCPPERAAEILRTAAANYECVVVDAANPQARTAALDAAGAAVLVMAPTAPSALRSRALLDDNPGLDWAIVTNRIGPGGELTPSKLEALLGHRIALELPVSAGLRDLEDEGGVLTSRFSRYLWKVESLARRLEDL